EFIRWVYLDSSCMLPTSDDVRKFVADRDPAKREKLIDSLIGSKEFANEWSLWWIDLLQARYDYYTALTYWTKEWLRSDRPYNETVYDMLYQSAKNQNALPTEILWGTASANS